MSKISTKSKAVALNSTRSKTLSVLMPAYKATSTIRSAIESAISSAGIEVIVAPDDGSADYANLANEYPGKVTVLEPTTRLGPGAGRNRAFSACSGEFVTMLDSDDRYQDGAIEEALSLCATSTGQVAFLRTVYVLADTATAVRALKLAKALTFKSWIEFGGGSIHAVFPRKLWRPYSETLMAQDLLHDSGILCDVGGSAPLTQNAYLINVHDQSVCATTDQWRFNRDYEYTINHTSDSRIADLFREKMRIGVLYEAELAKGNKIMYNDFLNNLQAPKRQLNVS